MNTVIELRSIDTWRDYTLLKKSIDWMKARNQKGNFSAQIELEEQELRSFFRRIKANNDNAALSSAA